MSNLETVNLTKEKIVANIQNNGPSYPAKIARELNLNPIFAAAFLSELLSDKRLKTSSLKVGSSHLYFIPGQEEKLETFSTFLNSKEKEAFEILKQSKILDDAMQEPAIRVALRKINDFAVQINVRLDDAQEKVFWKYYSVTDDKAREHIESSLSPTPKKYLAKPKQEVKQETPEIPIANSEILLEMPENKPKKSKAKIVKEYEFVNKVKDYLSGKDIEILASIAEKPKEFIAKIRIDTLFGKQEYLLIGKDKKKITEDDLAIALHKANAEKLPALIVTKGALNEEAKSYLEHWKNLIKIEKMK